MEEKRQMRANAELQSKLKPISEMSKSEIDLEIAKRALRYKAEMGANYCYIYKDSTNAIIFNPTEDISDLWPLVVELGVNFQKFGEFYHAVWAEDNDIEALNKDPLLALAKCVLAVLRERANNP